VWGDLFPVSEGAYKTLSIGQLTRVGKNTAIEAEAVGASVIIGDDCLIVRTS
jgi:UDP-3-O-[3-hydroxymyristoyl] glucosamine N-acyltransferase